MCCLRSQRDHLEWKAVTASIFLARQLLNIYKQGSKFLGRPPFFGNMVGRVEKNLNFFKSKISDLKKM